MHLANRLPPYSLDAAVPSDGDMPAPIERLFHGYISRHQVYREIDSYVATGTPALVHRPKVKGSDLEPRVRWAIAVGQRGKVTKWMCPFTKSRFKSRSFTAFTLRTGLNWSQFLGLGEIAPSAQARMLPQDEGESKVRVIELPAMRPKVMMRPHPVAEITDSLESGDVNHARGKSGERSDLCEFFPRIKNQSRSPRDVSIVDEEDVLEDELDNLTLIESNGEVVPPLAGDVPTDTPGVIVVDHKGKTVDTSPPSIPHVNVNSNEDDDDDNLYVDGCENTDLGSQPGSRKRRKLTSTRGGTGRSPDAAAGKDTSDLDTPADEASDNQSLGANDENGERACKRRSPKSRKRAEAKRKQRGKPSSKAKHKPPPKSPQPEFSNMFVDATVDIPLEDQGSKNDIEQGEAGLVAHFTIVTDGKMSWNRVCKLMHARRKELPLERHDLYRLWLLTKPTRWGESEIHVEDLPLDVCSGRAFLRAGIKLPYPAGPHWRNLCGDAEYRKLHGERMSIEDSSEESAYVAMRAMQREMSKDTTALALLAHATLAAQTTTDEFNSYINSVVSDEIDCVGLTPKGI
jgi:hypothetical protein